MPAVTIGKLHTTETLNIRFFHRKPQTAENDIFKFAINYRWRLFLTTASSLVYRKMPKIGPSMYSPLQI